MIHMDEKEFRQLKRNDQLQQWLIAILFGVIIILIIALSYD